MKGKLWSRETGNTSIVTSNTEHTREENKSIATELPERSRPKCNIKTLERLNLWMKWIKLKKKK